MIELRVTPTKNCNTLLFESLESCDWAELQLKRPVKELLSQKQQKELGNLAMKALVDGMKNMGIIGPLPAVSLH